MAPDDEILFGRVRDEVRTSYERVQDSRTFGALGAGLALALAEFELHGATLRSLRGWYPYEEHIGVALADWELLSLSLTSQGLAVSRGRGRSKD
ncbi:MAG TPA: hypothetical protein VGG89_13875 [Candidatus Baltobacteraceae bacterium]|jgi:hypothetical protein